MIRLSLILLLMTFSYNSNSQKKILAINTHSGKKIKVKQKKVVSFTNHDGKVFRGGIRIDFFKMKSKEGAVALADIKEVKVKKKRFQKKFAKGVQGMGIV